MEVDGRPSDGCVKPVRVASCVVDMGTQAFCRPLLADSNSPPFHSYLQDQAANQTADVITPVKLIGCSHDESDFLSEFNIPNVVVTSEPHLNVTDDGLLLSEPPIIIEDQSHSYSCSHDPLRTNPEF